MQTALAFSADASTFSGRGLPPVRSRSSASTLQLVVDQLDDIQARWRAANLAIQRSTLAGVGVVITARSTGGAEVSAIAAAGPRPQFGGLSVMPILYQPDLAEPGRILKAAGLRVRIRSTSGIWTGFKADAGGLVGLHTGTPQMELSFEHAGNIDEFAQSIKDAGYDAEVIDEAYNRTLVVNTPDEWALRINGAQDDLPGYTRAD